MLQLVEAGLLSPPPPTPFHAALTHWRETALAAQQSLSHPRLASAFAERQWQLLRELEHGLSLVEAPDDAAVPLDRVSTRVKAAAAAWESAGDQLRSLDVTVPFDPADAKALKVASQQLTDAASSSFSGAPAADVYTLLQLVPEANRAAAAVLARCHPQCGEVAEAARPLSAAATVLLENGDWAQVQRRPPEVQAVAVPETGLAPRSPAPAAAAISQPAPSSMSMPGRDREVFDADLTIPTPEQAVELARRRDVGVIAQAALDEIPAAVAMARGATATELGQLALDGRRAVAQLAAGAYGIAGVHSRRAPVARREDEFQRRMLILQRVAARWDPAGAPWSSYAWQSVKYALPTERAVALVGEADMLDHIGRPLLAEVSPPEERLIQAETLAVIHSVIADLHPDQRDAVEGILLRERTAAQLHEEFGVAAGTVRNRYRAGLDNIRARLRDLEHAPEHPSPAAEPPPTLRPDQSQAIDLA